MRRPTPADIHQDICTLRGVNQMGSCRYQHILHAGRGPGATVSRAIRRLEKGGYVAGDDRWISITDEGREALQRLARPRSGGSDDARLLQHHDVGAVDLRLAGEDEVVTPPHHLVEASRHEG